MADLTGKAAVPFELLDAEGKTHCHEDYLGCWQLLVFHRHLG